MIRQRKSNGHIEINRVLVDLLFLDRTIADHVNTQHQPNQYLLRLVADHHLFKTRHFVRVEYPLSDNGYFIGRTVLHWQYLHYNFKVRRTYLALFTLKGILL